VTLEYTALMRAFKKCHDNPSTVIADLHFQTVSAPHDARWEGMTLPEGAVSVGGIAGTEIINNELKGGRPIK